MWDGFAKWEIKNPVFSERKPQAGNCWQETIDTTTSGGKLIFHVFWK